MSAQLENGYVRIANEIWDEIIRRDFTKRQKDILQLVIRLSYGCNKKSAHIPMMQDFGICGVTKNHIKGELNYLKEMKVLNWSQDEMIFSFNKDYNVWQARPVRQWDDERFKELLHINLTSSQNRNPNIESVPKTGTHEFPKQELNETETLTPTKDEGVSKDSIKDIKELKDTTTDDDFKIVHDEFLKIHKMIFMRPKDMPVISELLAEGIAKETIIEVMNERYQLKKASGEIVNGFSYYAEPIRARHRFGRRERKSSMPRQSAELTEERLDYFARLRESEDTI